MLLVDRADAKTYAIVGEPMIPLQLVEAEAGVGKPACGSPDRPEADVEIRWGDVRVRVPMLKIEADLAEVSVLAFEHVPPAEEVEVTGGGTTGVRALRGVLEQGVVGETQAKVDLLVQLVVELLPGRMKDGDRTALNSASRFCAPVLSCRITSLALPTLFSIGPTSVSRGSGSDAVSESGCDSTSTEWSGPVSAISPAEFWASARTTQTDIARTTTPRVTCRWILRKVGCLSGVLAG